MATNENTSTAASSSSGSQATGDRRLKRHIGMIGLLFSSVGSIIGSGWLFGALYASQMAGPASVFSWLFGAIMILFIGLTYSELGTMFPLSGGVIRYPHFAYGSFASFTLGWVSWLAAASVAPVEVEAALQYANSYLPFLYNLVDGTPVLTTAGFFIGAAWLLVFAIINMIGIRWFARLNNIAVWWKLAIIAIVVLAFFFSGSFDFGGFSQHGGFVPMGWNGVFSAIATAGVVFSYFGFRQGVELAGETNNPQRNVPIAIIGSLVLCAIIYIALQVAFIGVLPNSALANGWANIGTTFQSSVTGAALEFGPLAGMAAFLGMFWLMYLLYIDAFVSPMDTGFIYITVTSRLSYAMGRNDNSPTGLTKVTDRGVPWIGVIVAWVVGVIFFLPFPGWQQLIGFVTSSTVLSFGSGPVVMMALRSELPDYKRPFRLFGGWIIPFLGFYSSNLIVIWSGWDIIWKLMLAIILGLILLGIHEGIYHKHTPKLDFRAGFWILPWFAGLALISYVGPYPAVETGAGNLGLLTVSWSLIVIAIFSALIMWLAHASRLHGSRVIEHINEFEDDAAEGAGSGSG